MSHSDGSCLLSCKLRPKEELCRRFETKEGMIQLSFAMREEIY